ncbi:hypothetical protein [Frankia sp. R43]|uniref:hypothetical protein n=1 Tax=Frankia sp. R43 TaxID=269536 RepID=UPI000A5F1586|nr:hypothetical protein [Frankia sp. R43]
MTEPEQWALDWAEDGTVLARTVPARPDGPEPIPLVEALGELCDHLDTTGAEN